MKENLFLKITIISIIFGFLAGAVGYLVVSTYLWPSSPAEVSLGWNGSKKKRAEGDSELKISETLRVTARTIVDIYSSKSTLEETPELLDQIYLPSELSGHGIILTSDGWIVTSNQVINDFEKDYLIVSFGKKTYSVQDFKKDKATNAVFLKIEAENLPVYPLGSTEELEVGQTLLVPKEGITTRIEALNYREILKKNDLIKSSEKFSKFILVADGSQKAGGTLVDLEGKIMGMFSSPLTAPQTDLAIKTAVPIDYIKSAFSEILRNGEIKRVFLGVNYLDLSEVFGLEEETAFGFKRGALLYENKDLKIGAVLQNSPAEKADLMSQDIILSVDEEGLSQNKDLTEIIQEYQVGDEVEFIILRNGKEQIIKVELE